MATTYLPRTAPPTAVLGSLALAALLASLLLASTPANAKFAPWSGTVTHVADGDTLWVRPATGGAPRKIRVDGIDAPEICQSYGPASKQALSGLVQGKLIQVSVRRVDTYGRELASLRNQGQDVGGWMVSQGHAWSYRYRRDDGPYAAEQARAQGQRLGVFADAQAERPRDFRIRHGSCH